MKANELCNCNIIRNGSSKLTAIYDQALLSSGIRVTQYGLLKYIYLLKSPNLKQLGSSLYQDRSTLGRNIRILERMKLVTLNSGKDKREVKIILTKDGIVSLRKARKAWKCIQKKIIFKLGKEKQEQLIEIMNDIQSIDLKL